MSNLIQFEGNVSLLTVPAAFLLCWAPHAYAAALAGKAYDNANPRGFRDGVAKSEALDKARKQRINRAEGASLNGFETLGFFATGVLAANAAGLGRETINALSVGYVVSRVVFLITYIHLQADRRFAALRSISWVVGAGMSLTLWIRAGLAVMRAS